MISILHLFWRFGMLSRMIKMWQRKHTTEVMKYLKQCFWAKCLHTPSVQVPLQHIISVSCYVKTSILRVFHMANKPHNKTCQLANSNPTKPLQNLLFRPAPCNSKLVTVSSYCFSYQCTSKGIKMQETPNRTVSSLIIYASKMYLLVKKLKSQFK